MVKRSKPLERKARERTPLSNTFSLLPSSSAKNGRSENTSFSRSPFLGSHHGKSPSRRKLAQDSPRRAGTSEENTSSHESETKGKEPSEEEEEEEEDQTQVPTDTQMEEFDEGMVGESQLMTLEEGHVVDYGDDDDDENGGGGSSTFEDEEEHEEGKQAEIEDENSAFSEIAASPSSSIHSSSSEASEHEERDKPHTSEKKATSEEETMATALVEQIRPDPIAEFESAPLIGWNGKRSKGRKRKTNGAPPVEKPKEGEEPAQKSRKKSRGISNKKRASLHSNQLVSIDRVKKSLGYGDVHVADGVREAISDSMNFFASKVLLQAKALADMAGKERVTENYISNALTFIIPYSPLSTRMSMNVENSLEAWSQYLLKEKHPAGDGEEAIKNIRVERACGLNVSISSLKNLAMQVTPTFGGIGNKLTFITLGAAVETMAETIIHRAVGAMISTSILRKSGARTLTREHVNVTLHYMTNTDQIKCYSSDPVYAHRRVDYSATLERAVEENSKRATNFRSKKVDLKRRIKERVAEKNARDLLTPSEITSFLVHDNTIPLVFRDLKLADTSTIVNIRHGALPNERMKRKYNTLVSGESIIQADKTMLKTLAVLHENISKTEEAQLWFAQNRE